jgi:hypothetical protein
MDEKTKIRGIAATAAGAALALAAASAVPATAAASGPWAVARSQARTVVRTFFRTLNARQYAKTCDLLSKRFFRINHVPNRRRCVLGLQATFSMTVAIRFRITGIRGDGGRAVVRAIANGAPGEIVLVKEGGAFKILSVGT